MTLEDLLTFFLGNKIQYLSLDTENTLCGMCTQGHTVPFQDKCKQYDLAGFLNPVQLHVYGTLPRDEFWALNYYCDEIFIFLADPGSTLARLKSCLSRRLLLILKQRRKQ